MVAMDMATSSGKAKSKADYLLSTGVWQAVAVFTSIWEAGARLQQHPTRSIFCPETNCRPELAAQITVHRRVVNGKFAARDCP